MSLHLISLKLGRGDRGLEKELRRKIAEKEPLKA